MQHLGLKGRCQLLSDLVAGMDKETRIRFIESLEYLIAIGVFSAILKDDLEALGNSVGNHDSPGDIHQKILRYQGALGFVEQVKALVTMETDSHA